MKLYKTFILIIFNVFDIISSTNQKTNSKYEINSDIDIDKDLNKLSSDILLNFSLISYGKWCGPSHGGYQDCCNGGPCKLCNIEDGNPTKECLQECEPIDKLDYYCAIHDRCCLNFDNSTSRENYDHIECYPEGNYCYCDCSLVKQSYTLTENECNSFKCKHYLSALRYVFENVVSCWYINQENLETCNKNNQNIINYCIYDII